MPTRLRTNSPPLIPPGGLLGIPLLHHLDRLSSNSDDIDAALHLCESLALHIEILRFVVCGVYEWLDAGELLVCEVTVITVCTLLSSLVIIVCNGSFQGIAKSKHIIAVRYISGNKLFTRIYGGERSSYIEYVLHLLNFLCIERRKVKRGKCHTSTEH